MRTWKQNSPDGCDNTWVGRTLFSGLKHALAAIASTANVTWAAVSARAPPDNWLSPTNHERTAMSKRVPSDPAPDYFDNGKPKLSKKKAPLPDRSSRTHHRLKQLGEPKPLPAIPDADPYDSAGPRKRTHWDLD